MFAEKCWAKLSSRNVKESQPGRILKVVFTELKYLICKGK